MAQLFLDSFGIYATADIPTRWVGGQSGASILNTPLPPNPQAGAQVLHTTGGGGASFVRGNNYGTLTRMIMGFRCYKPTSTSGVICQFENIVGLSSWGTCIYVDCDGGGTYIRNGTNAVVATGPVVPTNEWHHYELDCTFSTTGGGSATLYLDGNPAPFASATGLTLTQPVATTLTLGSDGAASNLNGHGDVGGYYADFYLFSGVGALPMFNAALAPQGLGAAKMAFSVPNGPGAVGTWTANGAATIWQCIDQIPQDGDTTYASSATVGQAYMSTFGALPAMQTLISVQLSSYARTDDAGPRAYQSGFYSGGSFGYSGMNQFLGGTYNYIQDEYMLNPINGLAWTPAALTGLQYGAELTV